MVDLLKIVSCRFGLVQGRNEFRFFFHRRRCCHAFGRMGDFRFIQFPYFQRNHFGELFDVRFNILRREVHFFQNRIQ